MAAAHRAKQLAHSPQRPVLKGGSSKGGRGTGLPGFEQLGRVIVAGEANRSVALLAVVDLHPLGVELLLLGTRLPGPAAVLGRLLATIRADGTVAPGEEVSFEPLEQPLGQLVAVDFTVLRLRRRDQFLRGDQAQSQGFVDYVRIVADLKRAIGGKGEEAPFRKGGRIG